MASKIEWTTEVWNCITGCSKISTGCKFCYCEREWPRLAANPVTSYYGRKFTDVQCHEDRLSIPLKWKRPRMIFVNSMSDLFHESVPDSFIEKIFVVMAQAKQHTFQILTKRPERMREWVNRSAQANNSFPLPNVWLGVSVDVTTCNRKPANLQSAHFSTGIKCN
ncbi:DUF5131 family protein [Methylomonas sp. AM2-LC]|uniref:DUF5131 family protein n=1 Tax=Methylomonas sp. AM2-LC TaxID=3153301 RepID=UPI00326581A1